MSSTNRRRGLQGPKPSALRVGNSSSTKMIKKSSHNKRNRINKVINPIVIYLRSPKIIHVRPEEFMSLVQRLTGKDSTNESRNNPEEFMSLVQRLTGKDSTNESRNNRLYHYGGDDESMKNIIKRGNLFDADY